MKKLTPKQESFVEHYAICLNGAESARRAGVPETSARQMASRWLSKDNIKAAIKERLDEKYISKEGVLAILGDIAASSMQDFVSLTYAPGAVPYIDIAKAAHSNKLHLLKKLKQTRRTRVIGAEEIVEEEITIELYDKQAAAVTMAKHHKLLVDRLEVFDWRKELEDAGLNPADEFEKLVNKAAESIAGGTGSAGDGSAEGSEETP